MNHTFPLFYSPKPRNQVCVLIDRNWSIRHITYTEKLPLHVLLLSNMARAILLRIL